MYDNWVDTVRETLDMLALALANENHAWTDYERKNYEDTIELLNTLSPLSQEERAAGGTIR